MSDIYSVGGTVEDLDSIDDDGIKELAGNLDAVFPWLTVFDGAHESEIKTMLEKAGLPASGKRVDEWPNRRTI